jgi:hypothetical protein
MVSVDVGTPKKKEKQPMDRYNKDQIYLLLLCRDQAFAFCETFE